EVASRLKSSIRGLLETVHDEATELGWHLSSRLRQIRWLLLQDCGHDLGAGPARERPPASHHLVKNAPDREDVGSGVAGRSRDLLRGHVPGRPHDGAGLR